MNPLPFNSIYRENFAVVEQRRGPETRFPHDEQLPIIWRALDLEFRDPLPGRIARVDQRADGFHKVMRRTAALLYCAVANRARADGVRLMQLPDPDLVARVTVVQQVTRESRRGAVHSFHFYGGPEFQPEIRLSGKRVLIADHVLQRFSSRVPHPVGADLTNLVLALYGSPIISMPLGVGHALVVPYDQSVLAFTYKETRDTFFLTTCLTVKEMNTLQLYMPPLIYNWHYGEDFTPPRVRNWVPVRWMKSLFEAWQRKVPLDPPTPLRKEEEWRRMGPWMMDTARFGGHGPGSWLEFQDGLPGPCVVEGKPGAGRTEYDELADFKRVEPDKDWDDVFAQRERFLQGECMADARQP